MIHRLLPVLFALTLLGPLTRVATAATILVPEDQPSIADAMAVAIAGDEISVGPGTYYENVVFPRDGITLRSRVRHQATLESGRFETVWDGRDDVGRDVASGVFHLRAWSAAGAVGSKATILR